MAHAFVVASIIVGVAVTDEVVPLPVTRWTSRFAADPSRPTPRPLAAQRLSLVRAAKLMTSTLTHLNDRRSAPPLALAEHRC